MKKKSIFSKKSLIAFLIAFNHAKARVPTRKELNKLSHLPSYSTYRNFFGSYSNAIKEAGFKINITREMNEEEKKKMKEKSIEVRRSKQIKEWKEQPKRKNKDGYIVLYKPTHPNSNSLGYLHEHRYIMSKNLGRPLNRNEQVYHKNRIRDDNRLKNLTLKRK